MLLAVSFVVVVVDVVVDSFFRAFGCDTTKSTETPLPPPPPKRGTTTEKATRRRSYIS